jgi:voltage-gated potassium channel
MKSAFVFNRCLAALIVLCVVAFVLESVPKISSSETAAQAFYAFEAASSCIFLAEYVARLWTCVEARRYVHMSPWRARLGYVFTLRALVDLVSCLPFFVELGGGELPTLTWLKAFRMFRILKSERYTRAFSSVYRVVWYNSEILGVALFIGLLLMMTTSTLLWYLAPKHEVAGDDADDFSSIPATFYLSILMLTGQGTPTGVLPWYTKIIVMLTAVFSVPIFVIPSSMLTWGFEAEAERLMQKKRDARKKVKLAERRGTRVDSSSSSEEENIFESDDEEAAWDEYERVVLGDDHDGGKKEGSEMSKEDRKLLRDVSNYFAKADVNADGTLSMLEFFYFARSQRGKERLFDGGLIAGKASPQPSAPRLQQFESRLAQMEDKLDKLLVAVQPKSGKR